MEILLSGRYNAAMPIQKEIDRIRYTAQGGFSYYFNYKLDVPPVVVPQHKKEKPHIVFTFWHAPPYDQAKKLMQDLHARFSGDGLPIGVGLFIRPMGDIEGEDFNYNPRLLETFLAAAEITSMPVFIITSGMHWTEVVYSKSPLLRHLESRGENLMKFDDGTRVKRKLQPPSQYVPGFLHGHFGIDGNGVLYLSHHAPEVKHYRERNLTQMAETLKPFASNYLDLLLGISTENEVDYPGIWITDGRKAGYEEFSQAERSRQSGLIPITFDDFRQRTVRGVLRRNVDIFKNVGLHNIYTNQSVEDAENRVSPLLSADIPSSNIGVTAWGAGNEDLYRQVFEMSHQRNKRWALVITNPLSLEYEANVQELRAAIKYEPDFIGLYNWWPHFWGYGIRGMAVERAVKSLTRFEVHT